MFDRSSLSTLLAVGAVIGTCYLSYRSQKSQKKYPISRLFVYPVKSCQGIEITEKLSNSNPISWPVDEYGLKYDRRWVVVKKIQPKEEDPASSEEVYQYVGPKMEAAILNITPTITPDGFLTLTAPNFPPIEVGKPEIPDISKHTIRQVQIYSDRTQGVDLGDEVGRWIDQVLFKYSATSSPEDKENPPRTYHLLTLTPSHTRALDPEYVSYLTTKNTTMAPPVLNVGYADGFPFLVTCESSLAALATEVHKKDSKANLKMNRFRPNIVISGTEPWAEDEWSELEINHVGHPGNPNGLRLHLVKPCGRCMATTFDPQTHEKSLAVLGVLKELRSLPVEGAIFGMNALYQPLHSGSEKELFLSVGDEVRVVQTQQRLQFQKDC